MLHSNVCIVLTNDVVCQIETMKEKRYFLSQSGSIRECKKSLILSALIQTTIKTVYSAKYLFKCLIQKWTKDLEKSGEEKSLPIFSIASMESMFSAIFRRKRNNIFTCDSLKRALEVALLGCYLLLRRTHDRIYVLNNSLSVGSIQLDSCVQ